MFVLNPLNSEDALALPAPQLRVCRLYACFKILKLKCRKIVFSVMIRGTMTPDTYKPVLRVSLLPIDKKLDGFHAYSSKAPLQLQWELLCLITLIYTSLCWENK